MVKRAVLLIGSPRTNRSTSWSLGKFLIDRLDGYDCDVFHLLKVIDDKDASNDMVDHINSCDLLILSTPLYVDQLPAHVIQALQFIESYRSQANSPRFLAIVNCGFPEALHNRVAIRICEQFARRTGLQWVGGLALGMGPIIDGKDISKHGGIFRNVRGALTLAANALSKNEPIPEVAFRLMEKRMIARWLYTFMGNRGWKKSAAKFGVKDRLYDRPCTKEA